MKKVFVIMVALALVGGAAYANYCARDVVPSATLLVPYAVVGMEGGLPAVNGYNTLLTVTNVSSDKQIIHVTVWNALSAHVVDFDEVLSGYDVWSISMRDMLLGQFGNFDTGKSGGYWSGTVGDLGDAYGPTTNDLGPSYGFKDPQDTDYTPPSNTTCGFPWGDLSEFSSFIIDNLAKPLIAYPTQYVDCGDFLDTDFASPDWLKNLDDSNLFFYVTVDTVTKCSGLFPDSDDYWTEGIPAANNVLIGDVFYLNPTANFSESLPAVHIEAQANIADSGLYTFYQGTPSEEAATYDNREPLATAFGFNYFIAGGITTDVWVWKDNEEILSDKTVDACLPYIYYAFDENEYSKSRTKITCPSGVPGCLSPEPNVFPLETQAVPVTAANFNALPGGNGWIMLIFDSSITRGTDYQAWVATKYDFGGYSTALEAATLANAHCFPTQIAPALGINYNYNFNFF